MMPRSKKLDLVDDGMCFACGNRNPIGLKLTFRLVNESEMESEFTASEHFQGFRGILHGGMMALLLDEIIVNLAWTKGLNAVSCDFRMRLKRASRTGERIHLRARLVELKKRLVTLKAQASGRDGELLAEATAKCVRISPGDTHFL